VNTKLTENLVQELRRGTQTLAVLITAEKPIYGYSLVGLLQEAGIDIEQNTLYPLLRRLESQGLLESIWDTSESRPRKYYAVTGAGRLMAVELTDEWLRINKVMSRMMKKEA
jgi:DNA-binding PadR family transcriptional regulator